MPENKNNPKNSLKRGYRRLNKAAQSAKAAFTALQKPEAKKAETEKKTAVTNAEAEAEALKIRAEAEAEANRTIAASLTPEIIENKKLEKWNGELPKVTGGNAFVELGGVE